MQAIFQNIPLDELAAVRFTKNQTTCPRILSKSQILELESCYLLFRAVHSLLQTVGNKVSPTIPGQLDEQGASAAMNLARLVTAFPEVADAAKRWGGQ